MSQKPRKAECSSSCLYIPATWEVKIRRITVQGQAGQKKSIETPILINKWGMVVSSAALEA
jgi:hypothetical protein